MLRVSLDLKLIEAELPGFRANLHQGIVDRDQLGRMKAGWHNQYAAHDEFCCAVIEEIFSAPPANVLECGSGFTSILLSVMTEELGGALTIFEDSDFWADIVTRSLRFLRLTSGRVYHLPLKSYEEFDWYDVSPFDQDGGFDLVVCDGPPGTTRGGRVGLLPAFGNWLSAKYRILLDDADREGELAALRTWETSFGVQADIRGDVHKYARVVGCR